MIGIAMALTVPLGLIAAVYLNEVGGRLARTVRTVVEAMTGFPSIVAGLFIFATYVLFFHEHTGMAAALALSVDMLPIIIRSADVVLRLVPGNLREASAALGAPDWRTVRHVVLPTARSGLATAVILGMARGLGETAPVLLTAGYTTYLNKNPLKGPMTSLPLATYELIKYRRAEPGGSGLRCSRRAARAGDRRVQHRPDHRWARPGRVEQGPDPAGETGVGPGRQSHHPPLRSAAGAGWAAVTRRRRLRWRLGAAATVLGLLGLVPIVAGSPAAGASYVPISGAGSTWSANAMDQWIADVQQYGMQVNYEPTGSSDGRSGVPAGHRRLRRVRHPVPIASDGRLQPGGSGSR